MATVTTTRHPVAPSPHQEKEQGGVVAGATSTLKFSVGYTSWCERIFLQAFTLLAWSISSCPGRMKFDERLTKMAIWFVSLNGGGVVSRIPHLTLAGDYPPAGPPWVAQQGGWGTVGLSLFYRQCNKCCIHKPLCRIFCQRIELS